MSVFGALGACLVLIGAIVVAVFGFFGVTWLRLFRRAQNEPLRRTGDVVGGPGDAMVLGIYSFAVVALGVLVALIGGWIIARWG